MKGAVGWWEHFAMDKVRGTKGEFWREDILDIGRVCIIEKVVEEIRNNRKLLQQIGWDNKDINLAQGKLGTAWLVYMHESARCKRL